MNNSTETIGPFLRRMREEKNISLKIISRRTKISTTMLELLEDDQLDKLPNKAYVTGYVKSYAKELNLSERDCISILNATYRRQNPSYNTTTTAERPASVRRAIHIPPVAIYTIVGIIVLTSLVLIAKKSNNITPTQAIVEPVVTPQVISETTPLKDEVVIPETPTPSPSPEVVESEEKESDPTFYTARNPLFTFVSDEETEKALESYVPKNIQKSVEPSLQNIYINAVNGPTWLTYKKDNDEIRKFLLEQGQQLFIAGQEIRLFFGNVNAIKVFYNNKLIDSNSKRGVKSLVFPIESQKKYKLPLFVFDDNGNVQTSDDFLRKKPN